jgi:molybdopterin-guanine dinucleotide biosynthesis protein A
MAGKMAAWQIPVVYSINLRQEASYGAVISPELLVIDAIGLPGPLEGLFSVHKKLPGRDLLLLACDMPDLDTATVATLLDAYREEGDKSAFFVFQDGSSFAEPFCGIYTAAGLAGAYQLAVAGKLSDLSLQSLLRRGPTKKIPITNKDVFRNYNEKGPAY